MCVCVLLIFTGDFVVLAMHVQFLHGGRSFQEVQQNLNSRAADLSQATTDVVTAASAPDGAHRRVAPASGRFSRSYEDFIDSGLEMAGVTQVVNGVIDTN